jgi:serine protease Do
MNTKTLLTGAAASLIALSTPGSAAIQDPITPPPAAVRGGVVSFADIVERVAPAVVSIDTKRQVPIRLPTIPGFPFDLFPDQGGRPPTAEGRAAASGFFISADGYIVTNNHVVDDATEISVTLKDQRELKARVVGRDEATDLAVLKVEGRNFPYVSFSNAATPRVGDWVIAVGNPFGLGGTATAGIVSAHGRDIGSTFVDYIQIDAPINRGNSGGPTFDAQGRVIGVNTAIFSPSGGNVGIGFAVPAEVAERITRDLIARGRIDRGYIGATVQTLTGEMAESLGLSARKGVLVSEVTPGGPADRAGLRSGDVVLRVEGRPTENASRLTREVAAARPGAQLRLELLRDGAPRTVEVRTQLRPSEREVSDPSLGGSELNRDGPDARLGIAVGPLDDMARRRWNLPTDERGVVVLRVDPDSDAAFKGLRTGDVIVRLNDRRVVSPADLSDAVAAARRAGRPSVLVFVRRDRGQLAIPVRLMAPEAARPNRP